MIPDPGQEATPAQRLAIELSYDVLETCAKFCEARKVKDQTFTSLVAVSVAQLGLLAGCPDGDKLRLKFAEALVNGYAEGIITNIRETIRKAMTNDQH